VTTVPPDRPRDSLGRPLSDDADPMLVVPGVPVRSTLTDSQAWDEGLHYLADGMPFHAHEVFEMRWRLSPAASRAAWRALAQWGAALTHRARGNAVGSSRLAARALETLDSAESVPPVIDVALVRTSCARLIA
jgi:hypothetical protein